MKWTLLRTLHGQNFAKPISQAGRRHLRGQGGQWLHLLLIHAGQLLQNLLGPQHLLQIVQLCIGIGVVPGVRPGTILRMACACRLSARARLRIEGVHGLHISQGASLCHPFICPCATLQACEVSDVVPTSRLWSHHWHAMTNPQRLLPQMVHTDFAILATVSGDGHSATSKTSCSQAACIPH